MSQEEILSALVRANQDRCNPPLKDREVQRIATSIARYILGLAHSSAG